MNEKNTRILMSLADLDPERWKPLSYPVNIDVPVAAGGVGNGSKTTQNRPYILTRVATTIIGNTFDPETSGLFNDGQYLITMADELTQYTEAPIHSDLLFGPKIEGPWHNLPFPIYMPGTHTLRFTVENVWTRVLNPIADTYQVQICLDGLADWGPVQ